MIIGVPKEIKDNEYRVGLVPAGAEALTRAGHRILVEKAAGEGSGISDAHYKAAGAEIEPDREKIFDQAEMLIKVKEPLPEEYAQLREGQILYTFLHLAANPELTRVLLNKKIKGIAYETIQCDNGSLPLLTPMSEIAGRMAVQAGAKCLEKVLGGRGVLLGGVPGVAPGKVTILGGGVAGLNAAKIALGMGAQVTVLDINFERLRYLDDIFGGRVETLFSNTFNIEEKVTNSDLVIGAVLIPGHKAPHLVTKSMVSKMPGGSVIVDISVDQGGCIETTRPTSHSHPTYVIDGVVHYCVTNMPGAVARTSTFALTNATLAYALEIASKGFLKAIKENNSLARGLNLIDGKVVHKAVAEDLGYEYSPLEGIL